MIERAYVEKYDLIDCKTFLKMGTVIISHQKSDMNRYLPFRTFYKISL